MSIGYHKIKIPQELYQAIKAEIKYELLSKNICFREQDFDYYLGIGSYPALGIKTFDFGKLKRMPPLRQIYKEAKLALYKLCEGNKNFIPPELPSEDKPYNGLCIIVNWCLRQQKSAGKRLEASGKAGDTKDKDVLTGEAKALALLVEHPDWTDKKIAKAVGVSRTTLYDWQRFKKAKEALKQGKNQLPKGSKNGETGDIEAWDEKD